MASISSLGVGSGLDLDSILTKLMTVEEIPLTKLDTKEVSYQTKISALGSLQGAVSALNSAVAALVPSATQTAQSKYGTYTATVANSSAATATASSSAVAGSYSLEVQQLATAHRLSTVAPAHKLNSASFASEADSIDQGTLQISIGGTTTNITVNDDNDTLAGLATAINASAAGVSASIEDDGSGGFVLALTSKTGGTAGKMTLSGIAGFTYDPETATGDLTQTQAAEGGYTSSSALIAEGTLSLAVGSGTAHSITIDSTNNTLAGLRDAINKAGAGVTASLMTVGNNDVRLVLNSNTMGSSGQITMSGLTGFAFNPSAGSGDLSQAAANGGQAAQGAKIKLNGITINKDSNTIADVVGGVTLTLGAVTTSATTLTVSQDKSTALSTALTNIVKAYNSLNTTISDLGKYDAETKKGGPLVGNSTLRTSAYAIKNMFQSPISGTSGDYKRLSDLGLAIQKDGSITFDSSKLTAATGKDFDSIATMVASFGTAAKKLTDGMLGTTGSITAATDGAKASIKSIDTQREQLKARLITIEARYKKQFSALDSLISSMNTTSTYLTQQLANLPGSSSK